MALDYLLTGQPSHVIEAIRDLERDGLVFCVHFGYQNAIEIRDEVRRAFVDGNLYEYLKDRYGI